MRIGWWCLLACCIGLGSCSNPPEVRFFEASNYPHRLSAWGVIRRSSSGLQLPSASFVYDLNTPLFTDYALKLRTLTIPPGTSANYHDTEAFDLPEGTIISKTFFYLADPTGNLQLDAWWNGDPGTLNGRDLKLVETRLLVKQRSGWDTLPYIWDGNEAYLQITGALLTLPLAGEDDLNYVVPSRNQCAGCHAENHTSGQLRPIGIKARHLHRNDPIHGVNQLTSWQARNTLSGLPALSTIQANARWRDPGASIELRARSYLDINCAHCHNPTGAADTSGLLLNMQNRNSGALGVCKPPIAAGRGSGGLLYSIVPGRADQSIMTYRMSTTDPATMMPELGRSLVHTEGFELISAWIDLMPGICR